VGDCRAGGYTGAAFLKPDFSDQFLGIPWKSWRYFGRQPLVVFGSDRVPTNSPYRISEIAAWTASGTAF